MALSYTYSGILQVEKLRKKKKAEVMVSQENNPFPESNTAMVLPYHAGETEDSRINTCVMGLTHRPSESEQCIGQYATQMNALLRESYKN